MVARCRLGEIINWVSVGVASLQTVSLTRIGLAVFFISPFRAGGKADTRLGGRRGPREDGRVDPS
jgi:hypothetical protein